MEDQINKNELQLRRFSWCDLLIIIALAAGIIASIPALKTLPPQSVTIFRDNQIIAEYPIDENRIFDVDGKKGKMRVQIKDKGVSVHTSTCSHQLCIRQGSISAPRNQIVCIPNHILITINAPKENDLDAVAR